MPRHQSAVSPTKYLREPQGAFVSDDGVRFRIWAPEAKQVEVVLEPDTKRESLDREENGYFGKWIRGISAGQLYHYSLDGGSPLADPASRFQPRGVDGPSEVIDSSSFVWTDTEWRGCTIVGQVIYEMHVGTFTPEGTFKAAAERIGELKALGITVIELMPIATFAGRFGWGYDGVFMYAPYEPYGRPEDFATFVDRAHANGIAVILDVVYNHFGPTGNVMPLYSPYYLSKIQKTDWGEAINFDGEHSGPVRDYFRENAVYWVRDFYLDGLRIDATQNIYDKSAKHIIAELAEAARASVGERKLILIAENEPQQSFYVRSTADNGYGLDGLWNDDFHHSAIVALTGHSDAYYSDYRGAPQEFLSAAKYGYLYQGQWYQWQKQKRGLAALDVPHAAFVDFIQNHDQIANSATGERIHELAAAGKLRAMTALMLLGPGTPMLFQGQEYASPTPFLFFADHCGDLAAKVRKGRRDFLKQWKSMQDPALDKYLADPCEEATFQRCKLDWSQREQRRGWYDLHADLLTIRRSDPIFSAQGRWGIDGAVLSNSSFVLRFFSEDRRSDRLLLVNLGVEIILAPLPEPLLAPPQDSEWAILWSSENPKYGGNGVGPLKDKGAWRIPGDAALVLEADGAK
ncbi:MAG TPA: malto-oligosyltrehalose trehalohydrolase [Bryobacteraceae bacterium]|nr:malto-oligosyltrehalose trehalohydrolase [Bryobacteraceae bacterium]